MKASPMRDITASSGPPDSWQCSDARAGADARDDAEVMWRDGVGCAQAPRIMGPTSFQGQDDLGNAH